MTLVCVQNILDLSRPATVELQRENMDIIAAEQEINNLIGAFQDMQTNVVEKHSQLYQNAVDLAHKLGIKPSMPRIVRTPIYRDNCPANNR